MSTKVIGSLMSGGIIVALIAWMGLLPDTDGMAAKEALDKLLSENATLIELGQILGVVGFVGAVLGLYLLARSLRDGGTAASATVAQLAGLLIVLCVPAIIIDEGLMLGAIQYASTDRAAAEVMFNAGLGTESIAGVMFGTGIALLGLALILRKTFHIVIGYLTLATGISMALSDIDALEILRLGWLVMMLLVIVMGVLTLRKDEI
jgi:hypothetical protein